MDSCDQMPPGGTFIGDPTSESVDVNGSIGEPYESGTCVGDAANWVAKRNDADNGWIMTLGYA